MTDDLKAPVRSAALMIGARVVNMAVGLLTLPVLIRYLGGNGFAAWAILLAFAGGVSLLEIGMAPTLVRFLSVPIQRAQRQEARDHFGRAWVLLMLSFGIGALVVGSLSPMLAGWLGLQATTVFAPHELILAVFAFVAARAFLQNGTLAFVAARRFGVVSAVSILQPVCSNFAAMYVAWQWGRLDLTLIAFWATQLVVLAVTFLFAWRMCVPRFTRDSLRPARLREFASFGFASQMEGWAQFTNFQFDKFLIAGLVGLWAVAPYEVGNRAVVALRSIPASGAETLLPTAMSHHGDPQRAWGWYLAGTRLAAWGVVLFMLAPLAVAPVFLYAWTGEMGYLGRWVFVALSLGAMASVLALPAATLAQAEGRPGLQGRAALFAIAINIPLSVLLVMKWGAAGAAAGTAVAMAASAAVLTLSVHRVFGQPLLPTLRVLGQFWPVVAVCLFWTVMNDLLFIAWFQSLEMSERYSRTTRVLPALLSGLGFVLTLGSVLGVALWRGILSPQERTWLLSALRLKRK